MNIELLNKLEENTSHTTEMSEEHKILIKRYENEICDDQNIIYSISIS